MTVKEFQTEIKNRKRWIWDEPFKSNIALFDIAAYEYKMQLNKLFEDVDKRKTIHQMYFDFLKWIDKKRKIILDSE